MLIRVGILVKVPTVVLSLQFGNDRPTPPLIIQLLPINLAEERMIPDPLTPARNMPEPGSRIRPAQPENNILRGIRHLETARGRVGKLDAPCDDLLVDAHRVAVPERRLADHKLVDQDAKRPPVDGFTVAGVANHFRGEILRRAAKSISLVADVLVGGGTLEIFGGFAVDAIVARCVSSDVGSELLREAEVDEFEMALGVDENIFGF